MISVDCRLSSALAASISSLALSGCCQPEGVGVYEASLVPTYQGCSLGEPLEVSAQTVEIEISEFNVQECNAKLTVRGPIVVDDADGPTVYPLPAWKERIRDEGGEGSLAEADLGGVEVVYGGEADVGPFTVLNRSTLGVWRKHGSFENLYRLQETGARFWFGTAIEVRGSQCFFYFDVELRRKS